MNKQIIFLICLALTSSKLFGAKLHIHNNSPQEATVNVTFGQKSNQYNVSGYSSKTYYRTGFNLTGLAVEYSDKGVNKTVIINLPRDAKGKRLGHITSTWVFLVKEGKDRLGFELLEMKEYKAKYPPIERFDH